MKHRLNIIKYSKLLVWLIFLVLWGLMSQPFNTQAAPINNTEGHSQTTPGGSTGSGNHSQITPGQITPGGSTGSEFVEEEDHTNPPVEPPSASVSPAVSPDAIAIRVFNNDSYLSPYAWYNRNVQAKRSLQSLIVDGYDAVRDDRTIYVAASNVILSGGNKAQPLQYSRLQPIIVIISFNQNVSSETLDILGQILNNWHFNQNIKDFDGTCWTQPGSVPGINCLNTRDCPNGQYCNSFKAKVVRDTRRLIDLAYIKSRLEQYRTAYGHYPSLEAGTYLTNKTLSVWPSWQKVLAVKLNSALPVDPINKLGPCPSGYNPETCWNEQQRNFATAWPTLPDGSRSYQYEYINSTNYNLCANFESNCSNFNNLSCSGNTVNHGPIIECPLLRGLAKKPFTRYVAIYDNEGDAIYPQVTVTSTALAGWQPLSVELVNNRQQIKISSAETGYSGRYEITITAKDSQGAVTNQQCSIVIGNGLCGNDQLDSGEDCDALEDIATSPENSSQDKQYACGDKCQFLDGWCGDGLIQSEYDEDCDCGDNLKNCNWAEVGENKNNSSSTNQYLCQNCSQTGGYCGDGQKNEVEPCESGFIYTGPTRASSSYTAQYECNFNTCTTQGGWCGDKVVQSNFEEVCEVSTWSSPTPEHTSSTYQYSCDAGDCSANIGGYCGDGVVQSNFDEVCEASIWQRPAPENTTSTYQYGCETSTCQANIGGWCGDGVIQSGENCDFNESFENFQLRMNDSNIDQDYYNTFKSVCQTKHCNINCFDLDNDGHGISGYNTGCATTTIDCDDRPAGADGLFNNADDGKNINRSQPDNCSQYDGIDNNCDGSPDNRAQLGGQVWSASFNNSNRPWDGAFPFGGLYATTTLDSGESVKLLQSSNTQQWPNRCTNFNCDDEPNCPCSNNQSLTGLTWDITGLTQATTAPDKLWLESGGNYVITFQYKGSANFLHPTTTVRVNQQTTTPVNQINWAFRKSNETNMLPTNFVVTSTNLVQATTYSDFNNYVGHFKYQNINHPYFSIFVGRNNINPGGASINIDNVAINVCRNHYPCPDDPTEYCWCGDGSTDSSEECDPSDSYYTHTHPYPTSTSPTKQYGCSPITCKYNLGGYCGDNIVQSEYGEICDNTSGTANTSANSSNNQYYCYRYSSTLRCVSSTGGWCGDGIVTWSTSTHDGSNTYTYSPNERCDYNSNPKYSKTPAQSNYSYQYECNPSIACNTSGGYCGDGIVQSLHGESYDCGGGIKCCFQDTDSGRIRVSNCVRNTSTCGDHHEDSCFEQCDYEADYHPPPGSTKQDKQYECTPPSSTPNARGECQDRGGYCGDGILQDTYDEQCDYNVTTTSAVNWSTSTEYCDENCQKKTIQAADGLVWTTVPGNSTLGTSDFQVMKYQAHILGHSAHVHEPIVCNTSTNNCVLTKSSINTPWLALVSRSMAYDMCAAIGAHLITNEEWMTIIRNVENVDDNWLGGAVAQGHLKTSSSSFILSNGETVSDLLSNYEEHINSYIVPSEGQWPTLISDDSCDDNYYTSWGNDCLTYNRYSSTQLYYPYNAIGNWGTLDSNKFLPGYYATGTITSRDVGYGAIQLSKNAPTMQYYLLRNGYEDSSNYHYGNKGLLQLKFLSSEAAYQAAFRCVRDITP